MANLAESVRVLKTLPASRNLRYAAELSPLISGKAEFADMYVSCCKKLIKVSCTSRYWFIFEIIIF